MNTWWFEPFLIMRNETARLGHLPYEKAWVLNNLILAVQLEQKHKRLSMENQVVFSWHKLGSNNTEIEPDLNNSDHKADTIRGVHWHLERGNPLGDSTETWLTQTHGKSRFILHTGLISLKEALLIKKNPYETILTNISLDHLCLLLCNAMTSFRKLAH